MLATRRPVRMSDPFAGFDAILRDMDRWVRAGRPVGPSPARVVADDDGWTVHVPLPGLAASAVHVEVDKGVLAVKAEAPARELPEGFRPVLVERRPPTVDLRWRLDESVDQDNITAELARGLLQVRLPRRGEPQARRIEVTTPGTAE